MKQIVKQNGVCFVILMFSTLQEIYLFEAQFLFPYWDSMKKMDENQSLRQILKKGHFIELGYHPRIDYIKL